MDVGWGEVKELWEGKPELRLNRDKLKMAVGLANVRIEVLYNPELHNADDALQRAVEESQYSFPFTEDDGSIEITKTEIIDVELFCPDSPKDKTTSS